MNKLQFRKIFFFLAVWTFLVFSVSIAADRLLIDCPGMKFTGAGLFGGASQMIATLLRWDAMHYLKIAYMGYPEIHPGLRAFFPAYPLAMRYGAKLFQPLVSNQMYAFLFWAFLLNFLSLVGSFLLIQRMWKRETTDLSQHRMIPALFLIVWPWAFFYLAPYPEAFCLFLFCLSFEMMSRRKWLWAGLAAAVASGTRLQGVFLFPALLVEYLSSIEWKLKKIRADILPIFLAPAGFLLYADYLGGIRQYFVYQQRWKVRRIGWDLLAPFRNYFEVVTQGSLGGKPVPFDEAISYHGSFLTLLIGIAAIVYWWKKWRPGIRTFLVISFAVPLFSSSLMALQRYFLLLFPLTFAMADFFSKRRELLIFWILIGGLLGGFWITLFTNGYFVS